MKKQPAATHHSTDGEVDHIQRCAVCKIDLKGRFVYADSEFEHLIGYSQDELFGRVLTDFTPEQEHELVNSLLVQQSQYESIHEAARVHLVDDTGLHRPVAMISALNFVAGNAVNFQVVFHLLDSTAAAPQAASQSGSLDSVLATLANSADPVPWEDHVELLRSLAEAKECLVYRIDDENLVLQKTSADPASGPAAVTLSSPTDDLHWWLSQSGERYRFDNADHVQAALEAVAEAPTELIVPIIVEGKTRHLVRCVFDVDLEAPSARLAAALDRVESFLGLLTKTSAATAAPVCLPQRTAEFPTMADLLNVGVCELRSDDSLGTVNRSLLARTSGKTLSTLKDFLAAVTAERDAAGRKLITDAVRLCRLAAEKSSCSIQVAAIDETVNTLTILREQDAVDTSLWLCLQPCQSRGIGAAMSRTATLSLLDHLHRLLDTAADSAAPLSHATFKAASTTQKLQLVTLIDSLKQAEEMVGELQQISSRAGQPAKIQDVDLNMLVGQVFERLRRESEGVPLNLVCGDLPVVRAACGEMESALFCIARTIVAVETGENREVRFDAELTESEIVITCSGKSGKSSGVSLIERLSLSTAVSCSARLHDQLSLAVALDSLKGDLAVVPGESQAIRITIPRS